MGIEPRHPDRPIPPGSNRGCRDVKHAGRLLQRPTTGRLEFQDRQSFGGWIVGAPMRIDGCHAGILDPGFLTQQGELLDSAVTFCLEPNSRIDTIGRPAASVGGGELGQRDDLQDGPSDVSRPRFRERDGGIFCFHRVWESAAISMLGKRSNFKISNEFA